MASATVVTGSLAEAISIVGRASDRLPTVLPAHAIGEDEGFTVISRYLDGVSAVSPQIEVPNRAVDVNSWAR